MWEECEEEEHDEPREDGASSGRDEKAHLQRVRQQVQDED